MPLADTFDLYRKMRLETWAKIYAKSQQRQLHREDYMICRVPPLNKCHELGDGLMMLSCCRHKSLKQIMRLQDTVNWFYLLKTIKLRLDFSKLPSPHKAFQE